MTTLCFWTAAAAAPPSASHPRRPRPDAAAFCGLDWPCRRGRAADLCGGHGGHGQHTRPWPRKGFRVVLGVALTRSWKGFVHWQLIFVFCFRMLSGTCRLRIHFVSGWASWNSGVRNEMKRAESRRNHVVSKCSLFFKWFWAWNKFWNCDRLYGTNFDSRTVRYFHCHR